jgi:hypothetical protein
MSTAPLFEVSKCCIHDIACYIYYAVVTTLLPITRRRRVSYTLLHSYYSFDRLAS